MCLLSLCAQSTTWLLGVRLHLTAALVTQQKAVFSKKTGFGMCKNKTHTHKNQTSGVFLKMRFQWKRSAKPHKYMYGFRGSATRVNGIKAAAPLTRHSVCTASFLLCYTSSHWLLCWTLEVSCRRLCPASSNGMFLEKCLGH